MQSFKSFKLAAAGLVFLFACGTVQAAPTLDFDFGVLTPGTHSHSDFLPDLDPNVLWFGFDLSATSMVDLNTLGSNEDTELGLYDSAGLLLGQNDDCIPGVLTSCLTFASLGAGSYVAGIIAWDGFSEPPFFTDFEVLTNGASTNEITLNVTARALNPVPVPAAVWLFGTALIGLLGFGKRRKTA